MRVSVGQDRGKRFVLRVSSSASVYLGYVCSEVWCALSLPCVPDLVAAPDRPVLQVLHDGRRGHAEPLLHADLPHELGGQAGLPELTHGE